MTLTLSSTAALRPSPVILLTARVAADLGMRPGGDKYFQRVRSGVYAAREGWAALAPWDRYLARVHAYALVNPGAVFCLESAAALWGLPIFGEPRDIHVFDGKGTGARRYGDVSVRGSVTPPEVVDGVMPVTSVLSTTLDLARVLPHAAGLAVADAAARMTGLGVSAESLTDRLAAESNVRGRVRVTWVAARIDARAESAGESISRAAIEWCGFPKPDLQVRFHYEGFNDRVDMYWKQYRAIGESDGDVKYADPDTARQRLLDEKEREKRLRRHEGGFARWSTREAQSVTRMRELIVAAGVPIVRTPDDAMLATLATNPRSK